MNIFRCTVIVVACTLVSLPTLAQSNRAIENELVRHLDAISKNADKGKIRERENKLLKQKLLKYARKASILKYDFKGLDGKMFVSTSKDGRFRIYSWDDGLGGTMRDFESIYQYQGKSGRVYSKIFPERSDVDIGGFFHQIFQLQNAKQTIYLANSTHILSTSLARQDIRLFSIVGEKLDPSIKLIRTQTAFRNSVGFDYDFFSVVDRPERPIRLFSYDEAKKQFRFPIVFEDKKFPNGGRVTNRFITYRFNGKYFVKVG